MFECHDAWQVKSDEIAKEKGMALFESELLLPRTKVTVNQNDSLSNLYRGLSMFVPDKSQKI